jgi:hypothetical protein
VRARIGSSTILPQRPDFSQCKDRQDADRIQSTLCSRLD